MEIINPSLMEENQDVNIYFIEKEEGNYDPQGFNLKINYGEEVRLEDIVYKIFSEDKAGDCG